MMKTSTTIHNNKTLKATKRNELNDKHYTRRRMEPVLVSGNDKLQSAHAL